MSLFRSEQLTIALCPDAFGVVRRCRTRGEPEETVSENLMSPMDKPAWTGAVTALETWLAGSDIGPASAMVVLSDRFARFALVPWSEEVRRHDEELALADACFDDLYGDMAGWVVRQDEGRYREPRLACAVESALLETLRRIFDARQIACPRIEPYFVACWNRWQRKVEKGDALFVVAESQGIVIASRQAGCWRSVRAMGGVAAPAAITSICARESLLQGFDERPTTWVHAPGVSGAEDVEWAEGMQRLTPDAPNGAPALVMARLGAAP